jgi:hypothetical protein
MECLGGRQSEKGAQCDAGYDTQPKLNQIESKLRRSTRGGLSGRLRRAKSHNDVRERLLVGV